ncbi:O-antigen ligase family protein, partial [Vibrio sp. F13]|uniref:O-antigen ligase family protein n=1 Tax=Vibrio sp. F13 TaxID=2070777 RepID=UPI0010BD1D66
FYCVILLVSLFLVYYLDLYSVRSKLESYTSYIYYLSQDVSTLDLRFIEGRIYFWIHALNIFQNNFFGLGLGTWGDFSSSFNPYVKSITAYNDSSDSALSHYLVEQGLFAILYLFIIYFSLKKSGSKVNSFFIILFILFLTNSGFSQPMFYLGFWINAILFYTIRKRVVINV